MPEENRIALSPEGWEWLQTQLESTKQRPKKFAAAMQEYRTRLESQQAERRALSTKVAAVADRLVGPCIQGGWGDRNDLRPLLEAAASSIVSGWNGTVDARGASTWIEQELRAWFGDAAVGRLTPCDDLAALVVDTLRGAEAAAAGDTLAAVPARSWNFRIVRRPGSQPDEASLELREVHYDNGKIAGWTQQASAAVGESIEELRRELQRMLDATWKPILDEKELEERGAQ